MYPFEARASRFRLITAVLMSLGAFCTYPGTKTTVGQKRHPKWPVGQARACFIFHMLSKEFVISF